MQKISGTNRALTAGSTFLHCFTLYQPLERGKVKLSFARFLQKISGTNRALTAGSTFLHCFTLYQPLERGKVK
ncbi:hypothetical protein ACFU6E_03375, partial [Bacillus cereus]|uniref:hypothetical protein n=1 Tax=Bacillus cereus TaxID=1396 RepID=UPI003670118F